MQKNIVTIIFFLSVFAVVSGCTSVENRIAKARKIAESAGLSPLIINTTSFQLFGYAKFTVSGGALIVFIEGDGLAYISKSRPSSNPTPVDPLTLRLAAIDSSPNVLYLARPCQYIEIKSHPNCVTTIWTTSRFSEEVIQSVNQAINFAVNVSKASLVHIVGYSGGGAVAALVAARRRDLGSLRTLSGYLDHKKLNQEKKVTPLHGSLDPIAIARSIGYIPQIHFSGSMDRIIPKWVAINFSEAADNDNCVKTKIVETSHDKGWVDLWQKIGNKIPVCKN